MTPNTVFDLPFRNHIPIAPPAPRCLLEGLTAKRLPVRIVDKGTWVFSLGERVESLFIVQEGKVLLTRLSADGREMILGFVGPGEFFGEVSLLQSGVAHFNAIAVKKTVLLALRKGDFRGLLEDPAACQSVIHVLATRCRDAWTHIEALGCGSLPDRVRVMLNWLCRSTGVRTGEGIELNISQRELAQMVGTTRESLNRQIRKLKRERILRVSSRGHRARLIVLVPEALEPDAIL